MVRRDRRADRFCSRPRGSRETAAPCAQRRLILPLHAGGRPGPAAGLPSRPPMPRMVTWPSSARRMTVASLTGALMRDGRPCQGRIPSDAPCGPSRLSSRRAVGKGPRLGIISGCLQICPTSPRRPTTKCPANPHSRNRRGRKLLEPPPAPPPQPPPHPVPRPGPPPEPQPEPPEPPPEPRPQPRPLPPPEPEPEPEPVPGPEPYPEPLPEAVAGDARRTRLPPLGSST
jgi:hypothetical protein